MYSTTIQQQTRIARATRQAANYTCRTSEIAGSLVVFVISECNEKVFTVNHLRRCNCEDFLATCAPLGIVCKHVVLADRHLDMADAPKVDATPVVDPISTPDPEEARWERIRRDRDLLWP